MPIKKLLSPWLIENKYYNIGRCDEDGCAIYTIEFDDQGELWNPKQLDVLLADIQEQCAKSIGGSSKEIGSGGSDGKAKYAKNGEVIVLTFIHGWMHNAARDDQNFKAFKKIIKKKVEDERDFADANDGEGKREIRPIIGVFIAWRGSLLKVFGAKYLTFWSRKSAALRVGSLSCTEVIFRIIRAVKSRNTRSQCIFVGHSFGGLILESAICKAMLGAIFHKDGGPISSPANLVVLINPACDAGTAKQFRDILTRNDVSVKIDGKTGKEGLPFPILISITSATDYATKIFFPIGQSLINWTKSYRPYEEKDVPTQWHLNLHTAGHVTDLHNFKVQLCGDNYKGKTGLEFTVSNKDKKRDKYEIVPKNDGRKPLPFWLMQVPSEIVNGHNDIFNDRFQEMLTAILGWSMSQVKTTKLHCNSSEQPSSGASSS